MQRLRSLRRSMSRSSRKSGGSPSSTSSSPRASQETPSRSVPNSALSTPDSRRSMTLGDTLAADPPSPSPAPGAHPRRDQRDTSQQPRATASTDLDVDALSQPQTSVASLSTSINDPPVIVEAPLDEAAEAAQATTTSAEISALETSVDLPVRRRGGIPENDAPARATETAVKPKRVHKVKTKAMPIQRPWLVFAVASGGFAALNGAFAKLTTASLTTTIAKFLSKNLDIPLELTNPVIRGAFFLLNILSNAIMWALFTRALTAHSSATKVSLVNTSANFLVTAFLGAMIFSEDLPVTWFGGAALLVLGTLIIGRDRKGEEQPTAVVDLDEESGSDDGTGNAQTVRTTATRVEKSRGRLGEMEPLLAGDETDGIRPDGEGEEES